MIVSDLVQCVAAGRSPLVLADRKTYLERLEEAFTARVTDTPCYRLDGQVGKKARRAILDKIAAHYETGQSFVLFATASLIGEGFDLPRLDTLVLSMPLSFKGRLVQYAGRLHRQHEAKADPVIFDYLDEDHAITIAMFRRRSAGYRELGYQIEMPMEDAVPGLFDGVTEDVENSDPPTTVDSNPNASPDYLNRDATRPGAGFQPAE